MKRLRHVIQKEDLGSAHRILLVKCEGKRQFGRTGYRCRIKVKKKDYIYTFLGGKFPWFRFRLFCVKMPCRLLKSSRLFGRLWWFHIQRLCAFHEEYTYWGQRWFKYSDNSVQNTSRHINLSKAYTNRWTTFILPSCLFASFTLPSIYYWYESLGLKLMWKR